jgi:arginyl-tRNA synthetase
MRQLREVISGPVWDALTEIGDGDPDKTLDSMGKPRHSSQGELALPCFALSKVLGKPPQDVAAELAALLGPVLGGMDGCEMVSSEGGFCNFFVDVEWLAGQIVPNILADVESAGHFRESSSLLIEHTSANPNGPFHVGRARNAILGDTLVRMHRLAGDEVRAEYYVDDMGKQVGILAWSLENLDEARVSELLSAAEIDEPSNHPEKSDHQRVRFYQAANLLNVQQGQELGLDHHREAGEQTEVGAAIAELVLLSEEGDEATLDQFEAAYQPVLDGMLETLGRLGIEFDEFTRESKFIVDGSVDLVMASLEASPLHGIEENGAHYLELESRGVSGKSTKFFFRRGDGSSLYATRDIAYHQWKWTQAERLVNILGEDHRLQSKQVSEALIELGIEVPEVVFYAFTKLPDGKMSTRRGNVVYMDDLLDEATARATEVVKGIRGDSLSDEELASIGQAVGLSAVRFNIIRVSPEKGINFRWEEALSFDSDSAPFIMYSHARACSINRRISASGHDIKDSTNTDDWGGISDSAGDLVKQLALFAEVLDEALKSARPNLLCSYLLTLSSAYNRFYRDNPVLLDGEVNSRNLALSEAARKIIAASCVGLGIIPIESM